MRRAIVAAAVVIFVWTCWELPSLARQTDPPHVVITIIGTNDLHGGILPVRGRGGLALLGGYLNILRNLRASDAGAVVLIDAGDMFQGTLESNLTEGAPVVAAYNQLGYAAAAIGNHEFDFGPAGDKTIPTDAVEDPRGALKARAAEAKFPFLAANILDAATGQPINWPNVKPSVMIEAAGLKVGIVGVVTGNALTSTIAPNVRDLAVTPLAPAITREAMALRSAGATLVVVAAHAGGTCERFNAPADLSSCSANFEIMRVARDLRPGLVDVIVAGHAHLGMAHEVAGIAIIESYYGGRAFGRVDVTVERKSGKLIGRRIFPPNAIGSEPYEAERVVPDPEIERILASAAEGARVLKARPLGVTLETPLRSEPDDESEVGNLFADLMRQAVPGSDVALTNSGGVRSDLPAGPLTYGGFFTAMPFDNRLVTLRLTGAQLRQIFANNFRQSGPARLPVSGVRVTGACVPGALRVTMVRDSGVPVRDDELLTVVTNDFIALGGNNILAPLGAVPYTDLPGPGMRDAMVEQLQKRGGRLKATDLVNAQRPRIVYPPARPVRCP